jgi:hypothetical protein
MSTGNVHLCSAHWRGKIARLFKKRWEGRRLDPRLQRLFTSLGATFEAEIARDEEEAAEDLAFSLRQGRSLADVLERNSWQLVTPAGPRQVTGVGKDYVVAGGRPLLVAPLSKAAFVSAHGAKPLVSDNTLLQLLRSLARSGARVEIGLSSGTFGGRLLWTGTDHVVVETARRRTAVGLGAIEWVRLEEGLEADVY